MFTFDLAEELEDTGVTANCLHPGTYMPTNMVQAAGIEPRDPARGGDRRDRAADRLRGGRGRQRSLFDGVRDRRRIRDRGPRGAPPAARALSEELTGIQARA